MKRLNLYIYIITLLSFAACSDDYEAPFPVSDVSWYTSMPTLTEYAVKQDEMMGFIDASQGVISHEWIIEEGSYFLKEEVLPGDIIADFIDEEIGLVSKASGINVYFPESGRKSVRLKNTFAEKVTFNGARPIEAVEKDGVWVIDTTFTVDVYGDIMPAYKVCTVIDNPDGSVSPGDIVFEAAPGDTFDISESDTWELIEVEVGSRLMFIDLTKDEHEELVQPDTRTWTIRNNSEPFTTTDSSAIAYFNVYGYATTGLGSLKSERNGAGAPTASAQQIIPLKLKVIQSSQPFTYADGAIWTSSNTIDFNVSGEVNSLGTNPESGFTVHVTNTAKGFDQDIAVTSVSYLPTNKTRLTLTLAEEIYSDDVITVSFDDAGTDITSVDERNFVSFDAKAVGFPEAGGTELLDDGEHSGFENGTGGINKAFCPQYWVGGQDALNPEWARTTDPGKQAVGEASMKFNGNLSSMVRPICSWMQMQKNVDMEAGAYEVSHQFYIEEGSNIEAIRTTVAPKAGGSWPTEVEFVWDLSSIERGKWVTLTQSAIFPNAINVGTDQYRYSYIMNAADNPGASGVQTVYIDDLKIVKVEAGLRP